MANTIKHKRSGTAGATPSSGSLVAGELAINTADGKLFTKRDNGTVVEIGAGGGGTPAGSTGQVQFNNSGAFGADNGFTFDPSTEKVVVGSGANKAQIYSDIYETFLAPVGGALRIRHASGGYISIGDSSAFGPIGTGTHILVSANDASITNNAQLVWNRAPLLQEQTATFQANVNLQASLLLNNSQGTNGQVLTSTGSGVQWATPSSGGGGVPTISQAYAVTEGYGVGDFGIAQSSLAAGVAYNGPLRKANSFVATGLLQGKAGIYELGVRDYNSSVPATSSVSALGGWSTLANANTLSFVRLQEVNTTFVACVRIPTLNDASHRIKAAVGFSNNHITDFNQFGVSFDSGVYFFYSNASANWMIKFRGTDIEGYSNERVVISGVPVTTSWFKLELIATTASSVTTFVAKINGNTITTINTTTLENSYGVYLEPSVVPTAQIIKDLGTGTERTMWIDHMSVLSEVTR
jgi:hypothetical protein